jgi:hypothetical protein
MFETLYVGRRPVEELSLALKDIQEAAKDIVILHLESLEAYLYD